MWKSTKQLILSGGEDENSKSCILVPCIENEELRKALADGGFPALVGLKEYFVPFSLCVLLVSTWQYPRRLLFIRQHVKLLKLLYILYPELKNVSNLCQQTS